ncbi:MAG: RdgB/HAM1 family non-canonical purine NTP pyrophosphatase [Planctomycetia bacterium]|jgi:XTP/dITP diphosphohydrolase
MKNTPTLVLGTGNRKKGIELIALFGPVGLNIKTLADFNNAIDVEETGTTFAENAALKATEQAKHLGCWVLAEDSGLAVDALDGEPGVFSARYSGEGATDEKNNALVLEKMEGVATERRRARFICHMTLSDPTGTVRAETEAFCTGRLLTELRGTHGFGYDPMFEIVEYHRTFAELGPAVKRCLSHRARAARQLIPELMRLVDSGQF